MQAVKAVIAIAIKVLSSAAVKKVVVALAINALARQLAPKSKDASADRSSRFQKRRDASPYREVILGTALTGGVFVDGIAYSTDNMFYCEIVKLADHECDGLQAVFAGGRQLTINGDGSVQEYIENGTPRMWIYFQPGAWGETTHSEVLTAFGGRYTSNDRGRGVCRVVVKCDMRSDTLFPGRAPPELTYAVRGAKIFSPRLDTTQGGSQTWGNYATYAWSNNLADIAYNVARGIYVYGGASPERLAGGAYDAEELPIASWAAESSACEVAVSLKAGGTEKRYTGGLIFSSNEELEGILADLAAGAAGFLLDLGGTLIFQAGIARTPVATLADTDFIAGKVSRGWRQRARERYNTISGRFTDPALRYMQNALPTRRAPADIATDNNEERVETLNLGVVQSNTQGQRVMEIRRRQNRRQHQFQVQLPPAWQHLEAGDWVTYTSARRGWTKTFVLMPLELKTTGEDMLVSALSMIEVNTADFTWTPATDELDVTNPAIVGPGSVPDATLAGLTAVSAPNVGTSDSSPAILVTWNVPSDPTINTVAIDYKRPAAANWLTQSFDAKLGTGQLTGLASGDWQVRGRPITNPLRPGTATGTLTVSLASLLAAQGPTPANMIPGSGPLILPGNNTIGWLGDVGSRWEIVESNQAYLGLAMWKYSLLGLSWDELLSPIITVAAGDVLSAGGYFGRFGAWSSGDVGYAVLFLDSAGEIIGSPTVIGWALDGVDLGNGVYEITRNNFVAPAGTVSARFSIGVANGAGSGYAAAWRFKMNRGATFATWSDEATTAWMWEAKIGANVILPDGTVATEQDLLNRYAPRVEGPRTTTIQASFTGEVLSGELPRILTIKRYLGPADVSASTTWSLVATGCSATITDGVVTITACTVSGSIIVTALRDGLPITHEIEVLKNLAAPPVTGGGGATVAVDTTIDPTSSTTLVTCGGPITVRAGAAGTINFAAYLSFTTNATVGKTWAAGRIRYRVGAGAWSWAGAESTTIVDARGYPEPEVGEIDCGATLTGLTAGTDYECELQLRRSLGAGTLSFIGSFAAEAS